ncbi:hypothetical protein BELINDA_259 [Bacillus phage Belinda]|uniref:hypothetical protein n=1 Tax=Bacillus phage Belinda TaxID=1852564 RepID=UPI0007F11A40|nr:hypothetical protein BI039_gp119 [Bacillus phage Belinda]ANM46185.1 hypothetical protein BELINDA_259 [Bacillus phage Belinda]
MRFTDKLEVVNEQMGRQLEVREALSQCELIVSITDSGGVALTTIYLEKEEVVNFVKSMHKHFRREHDLYKSERALYFKYMVNSKMTAVELNRNLIRINELDLQKICLLFEKWLTHHGVEFEGMDYKKEQVTLKLSECKKDLQFFTNEKASIISSMTSVTNDTVLDVLVCDLKEANRNIERLEKTLQDCIDRLAQF